LTLLLLLVKTNLRRLRVLVRVLVRLHVLVLALLLRLRLRRFVDQAPRVALKCQPTSPDRQRRLPLRTQLRELPVAPQQCRNWARLHAQSPNA
jgi:hypothetical protein